MDDRIPTPGLEGRVKITKLDGTSFLAFLEMADNPSNTGTPIVKATLLKDATAALFGLTNTAVPDDVLSWLGKYNQHWWSRTVLTARTGYREVQTQYSDGGVYLWKQVTGTIQYASSITINQTTGMISLVNPQSIYVSTDQFKTVDQINAITALLDGKYALGLFKANSGGNYVQTSDVFYVPAGTKWDWNYSDELGYYYMVFPDSHHGDPKYYLNLVTTQIFNHEPGAKDIVWSTDRNAYPDSGESDGYEWQYLGVPFDNAVTAPKIVTGSYIGTGKYGTSNKNTLTFDSEPKMVFVTGETLDGSNAEISTAWAIFTQTDIMGYGRLNSSFGYTGTLFMTPNWSKTLEWWSTSASLQGNVSGTKYRYIAIS